MEQQEEKNVSFFRFEDLRVYAKATDYASWISRNLVATAEPESQKTLISSFCHFDHYLKIAKTAIRECVVYTEVAHNLSIFDGEQYERSRELLMELTRMLGALIISLQRSADRRADRGEDEASDPYSNDEMSY